MMHVFKLAIRELIRLGFTIEQLMDIVDDIWMEIEDE